jgi:hypothetical protein
MTNNNQILRVAAEDSYHEVEEMTLTQLCERLDNERRNGGTRYRHAEYVESDSPYTTWEDVRRYGYSCRAHMPYSLRRF